MHFWIDKRSQANINQCRANARHTLNRLQPLEYVRPPHQHYHHNNSSSSSSNHTNHNYIYSNLSSSNSNNNNNNNNIHNNSNSQNNNNNNFRNSNANNSLNRSNIRTTNSTNSHSINSNMINTAATGSAHSSYRIPHHQNIDVEPSFVPTSSIHHSDPGARTQPHLRWQVLVIFTFFVVTIRFYVLGNRSEVLIYCISGLILVMALLIFSALNLQKKLTNGTSTTISPRFDRAQRARLINAGVAATTASNHPQIATGSRCPYVQQLVLQNAGSTLNRNDSNRNAQIIAEAVVLLPPSPTHLLQDNLDFRRNHSQGSIAPPPYDMAILLPNKNRQKFVGLEIESSEDETPPPSYAAVTDINN